MFRLVNGVMTDCKGVKEEDVWEKVMESCVSVGRKEVMFGRIIWNGP